MTKHLESLLFSLSQSPYISFDYQAQKNLFTINAYNCDIEIVSEPNNFCTVNFNYVVTTPRFGRHFKKVNTVCAVSRIEDFLSYCIEQVNVNTKDNKAHIEEIGLDNFLNKQAEVLKALTGDETEYKIKSTQQEFDTFKTITFCAKESNKKILLNFVLNFENQSFDSSISFGLLKARAIIDGPVLDGFDLFIPVKDAYRYKILKSNFNCAISEEEEVAEIIDLLAIDLSFFKSLKIKNTLEVNLEEKITNIKKKKI